MSRTPNTPFIPPLPPSSDNSPTPEHPPVIPTSTPNWNQSSPFGGNYTPYPASPYSNQAPFIPELSPMVAPGVIPGNYSPQQQPKVNRHGLSEDFTGYPQGPAVVPPLLSPQHQSPMSPYGPHPGSHPNSPHYPHPGYPPFSTPWAANNAQLPSTPWTAPPRFPQPFSPAFGSYGPPPPLMGPPPNMHPPNIPPPQAMNVPPPHMTNGQGHPGWPGPPGIAAAYPQFHGPDPGQWQGQPPHFGQPYRVPPEPPAQIFDRMNPFTEGKGYGAVLDPFLIRVVRANVQLNPLITPLPEDGSERVHLIWNMLFPTSTIQRSTDPSHISWSKGRDAPATFPRISSLRIVSDTIPWVLNVKARDNSIGVTCGEVIDSIGHQLCKFSDKHDYDRLPPSLRPEVGNAYRRNRSREPGVPGGQLGEGMKRLDFLRRDTMFAGIEVDDRVVKRVCGDTLPCVFILKCSKTLPMTRQEVEDRQARLRTPNTPRSRANSTNTRIMVQPPSTTSSDDDAGMHR